MGNNRARPKLNLILSVGALAVLVFSVSASVAETKMSNDISQMEKELEKDSDSIPLRLKIATYYSKKKLFKKVIDLLNGYSADLNEKGLLLLAKSFTAEKDSLNETRIYKILVNKNPNSAKYHLELGRAYMGANKLEEASQSFRKSVEISPKYEDAHAALFELFQRQENNYESRVILLDMIKKFGRKPKYMSDLCRLYTKQAFLKEAIDACSEAITLNPKSPENHSFLAQSYFDKGDVETSERILKTAARQFKSSDIIQNHAGKFYFDQSNFGVAFRYYAQAVKANKESLDAQIGMARSGFKIGKLEVALNGFDQACRLDVKTTKYFKEAVTSLRLEKNHKWERLYNSKLFSCRR